jgi:16S rRNA (cytidine1402-2'-O)-methyltransferase
MSATSGKVFLVPTPIGNLGDITQRALEVLAEVDVVACEDTRVTGRLLSHFGIKKPLVSYHEFNERSRARQLAVKVKQGKSIAIATDAGSPGISDPAYRVVRAVIDNGLELEALPGPTAIIPALTASGLPTDRFFYEGFLSHKKAARTKRLRDIAVYPHTLVFYESPHRVHKCLKDMLDTLGNRRACVAREITKKFEQYIRGTISEILEQVEDKTIKGEIVIVVAGNTGEEPESDNVQ